MKWLQEVNGCAGARLLGSTPFATADERPGKRVCGAAGDMETNEPQALFCRAFCSASTRRPHHVHHLPSCGLLLICVALSGGVARGQGDLVKQLLEQRPQDFPARAWRPQGSGKCFTPCASGLGASFSDAGVWPAAVTGLPARVSEVGSHPKQFDDLLKDTSWRSTRKSPLFPGECRRPGGLHDTLTGLVAAENKSPLDADYFRAMFARSATCRPSRSSGGRTQQRHRPAGDDPQPEESIDVRRRPAVGLRHFP
jgi:hypothetical protein